MVGSLIIPSFIAFGVFFMGRFIGKRFTNFHESSYLGFAVISFIMAFIFHTKVQNAILTIFVHYPFINRRIIILLVVAICLIAILFILRMENRIKTVSAQVKTTFSKSLSANAVNAYLADKPHKCSHCGYSFSLMPKELEKGKSYFVKAAKCPKCENVDQVLKSYKG